MSTMNGCFRRRRSCQGKKKLPDCSGSTILLHTESTTLNALCALLRLQFYRICYLTATQDKHPRRFCIFVFRLFTATGDNKRILTGSFTIIHAGIDLVRKFWIFFKTFLNGARKQRNLEFAGISLLMRTSPNFVLNEFLIPTFIVGA